MWTNSIINTQPDEHGRDVELYMEYGRKWVVPRQPDQWTSLANLDFSVVGDGSVYSPASSLAQARQQHTTSSAHDTGGGTGNDHEERQKRIDTPTSEVEPARGTGTGTSTSMGTTSGILWHTYTMPRAGTFLASWFHTHANAPSDM